MYTGIAIYNSSELSPMTAYELGSLFFSIFDITITGAGYLKYIKNSDHEGDHDLVEISFIELKEKIFTQEATAFRIYSEQENHTPWLSSFGYITNEFGGFYHIDIQFPNVNGNNDKIISFIKLLVEKINFSYGIIYNTDKITKAFYYAGGDNLASIYPYENPSIFKRETPGRFNGKERYNDSMLRMVYPYNIINNSHLEIKIENVNLKKWILSDKENGSLEKLNDELWLWKVEQTYLNKVNQVCGEADILIAWKTLSSKKIAKKLP
ncbi:hypothetical protein AB204_16085 [Xenorhabdus khoisanae]|uniref:Uncharacterized protein n=1 Tax=Xenorhabdus khoisanae TaxID=880157 RepID=A0A0J5FPA7_9GAMM|nr:hypothetical protein [Xenorhabdus khoisanae]KMJ44108.1 hypothetical protein AB204_16085 [Xenorhabdus khoisanae]